jgi:hypothetical protein
MLALSTQHGFLSRKPVVGLTKRPHFSAIKEVKLELASSTINQI